MAGQARWFVREGDKTHGPITSQQLKTLARDSKISPDTRIRRGPDGQWVSAQTVKGLFTAPPKGNITATQPPTTAVDDSQPVTADPPANRVIRECEHCYLLIYPSETECLRCGGQKLPRARQRSYYVICPGSKLFGQPRKRHVFSKWGDAFDRWWLKRFPKKVFTQRYLRDRQDSENKSITDTHIHRRRADGKCYFCGRRSPDREFHGKCIFEELRAGGSRNATHSWSFRYRVDIHHSFSAPSCGQCAAVHAQFYKHAQERRIICMVVTIATIALVGLGFLISAFRTETVVGEYVVLGGFLLGIALWLAGFDRWKVVKQGYGFVGYIAALSTLKVGIYTPGYYAPVVDDLLKERRWGSLYVRTAESAGCLLAVSLVIALALIASLLIWLYQR